MSEPVKQRPTESLYVSFGKGWISTGLLLSSMDLCRKAWSSALEYIVSSPPAVSPKRLIATPITLGRTILEQLDLFSKPTHSIFVDLMSGDRVEVSETFVFDLNRLHEDEWLFIQGTLVEPAQNKLEKVLADLFDLVGRDKALLRTLTEICNQRAWIDLRNFIQGQYYCEWGEYPMINSQKRQSLSIYKDEEGTITVSSCLQGDIVYECRQGAPVKLAVPIGYIAACEYDLATQTIEYQHTFT